MTSEIAFEAREPGPHMGVPGAVPPLGRMEHEMQKYASSLRHMPLADLKDHRARQIAITNNKKLLQNLADKGERVKRKLREIEKMISEREAEFDATSVLTETFSNLNIGGQKVTCPEDLEWKLGAPIIVREGMTKPVKEDMNEVDNEALHVLVERELPKSTKHYSDWHQARVARKEEEVKLRGHAQRFLPFHDLQHEEASGSLLESSGLVHKPKRDSKPKELMPLPKNPDSYKHAKTVEVSITESLELQKEAVKKLEQAQLSHAKERLGSKNALAVMESLLSIAEKEIPCDSSGDENEEL